MSGWQLKYIAFASQTIGNFFLSQAERNAVSFQDGVGEKFCCIAVARFEVPFFAESIPTETSAIIVQRKISVCRSLKISFFLQLHFKCLYAVGSDGYIQLVLVEVSAADLFFRTVCKYCLLYFTGEGDGCLLRSCASCFIYTYYIFIGYFRFFQRFDNDLIVA